MNRTVAVFCIFVGLPLLAENIRLVGPPFAVKTQIEVWSSGGALLYASDWKDGNLIDWPASDIASGTYRLVMKSRNLTGETIATESEVRVDATSAHTSPKITIAAHDGQVGQIITSSGDLSFRFGDFLNHKDVEAMRLSPTGELTVHGRIHADGIVFPDGTTLGGAVDNRKQSSRPGRDNPTRLPIVAPATPPPNATFGSSPRLIPQPNAVGYRFQVLSDGVHIGLQAPSDYGLDVAGPITAFSNVVISGNVNLPATTATNGAITVGGNRFMHAYGDSTNTFAGTNAGNFTLTGTNNTGVGYQALMSNTTGSQNVAVGSNALPANTTGSQNVAVGHQALLANTVGNANLAAGYFTMVSNTDGNNNVGIGSQALRFNTSGSQNTALGNGALINNTTGNNNIGIAGGSALTTGNDNIDIGNAGVAGESATTRIGTECFTNCPNPSQKYCFIAAIRGKTTAVADAVPVVIDSNGQLGTVSSSSRYKFDISDMGDATDNLMHLRPVTFRYFAHGQNAPLQYGLIAEEVAGVYPELVTHDHAGQVDAIKYQFLAPMLLNQVQKDRAIIDSLKAMLEEQSRTIEVLTARIEALSRK